MIKQLGIDYSSEPVYRIDNFYIEDGGISPLDIVLNPKSWGSNLLIISGEKGSGKTHLSNLYVDKFNVPIVAKECLNFDMLESLSLSGCVIDDINDIDEKLLFHLINMSKKYGSNLLFTVDKKVKDIDIKLPDLKSRLLQAMVYNIEKPSDSSLHFVMLKNFIDKQLRIKSDVMSYIIERTPRSYSSVIKLVDILDKESLACSNEITIPFVRKILQEYDI